MNVVAVLYELSYVRWEDVGFVLVDSFGDEEFVSFEDCVGESAVYCMNVCWCGGVGEFLLNVLCEGRPVGFVVVCEGWFLVDGLVLPVCCEGDFDGKVIG